MAPDGPWFCFFIPESLPSLQRPSTSYTHVVEVFNPSLFHSSQTCPYLWYDRRCPHSAFFLLLRSFLRIGPVFHLALDSLYTSSHTTAAAIYFHFSFAKHQQILPRFASFFVLDEPPPSL